VFSGTHWKNPSTLPCWSTCASCFRCEQKGRYPECNRCSGRHDTEGQRDPYDIDDRCRCTEGILQYRLKNGRLILKHFYSDPFAGQVMTDTETADEMQWRQYVTEQREKMNDPTFDPVQFDDGTSTLDYIDEAKKRGL